MVESKKCCANCIGDSWVQKEFIPIYAQVSGQCSYCSSTSKHLVDPSNLRDVFGSLIAIYQENEEGKLLIEWLRDDWGMFPIGDIADANLLLADILCSENRVRKKYIPSEASCSDGIDRWNHLKEELISQNRFFLGTELIETNLIGNLMELLLLDPKEVPRKWYRARVQHGREIHSIAEMGAPPRELALSGRANPVGIPYLYLASDADTAVSEIRPHTGEMVNVAEFEIPWGEGIIDLRVPRSTVSPLIFGEEGGISRLRKGMDLLHHFGEELAKPVLPKMAAIDYIPSQYLCEFIKYRRHQGVMYRSSVGSGYNLALFYPDRAQGITVKQHKVSHVKVEHKPCSC